MVSLLFSKNNSAYDILAKKVFIKSYGCQMNMYDSDRMADILATDGYSRTHEAENADLVILNTCHIREKAAEKVYSELGRLRKIDGPTVAVAGCVAQAEGEEVMRRSPNVDLVVGPQTYHRLPELLRNLNHSKNLIDIDFPVETKFNKLPPPDNIGVSAFLTIQEGCDKFCAFCVVPYTRGAEYSRPIEEIICEAEFLVEAGAKEIILLGQNVNAYHGCSGGLAELIRILDSVNGLDRIRYTTSHPNDMSDALIAAHAEVLSLMPYLHLPVQSGSNRILERMNRRHTKKDYENIIRRLRAARPDLALSSDFIVGHPGETEEDFEETMSLIERVNFAQAYSFKYSARPGTPAAKLTDQVPESVKIERLSRLQELLGLQQLEYNKNFVGKYINVLLDRIGRKKGQLAGRTPYNQAVHVKIPDSLNQNDFLGKTVPVYVEAARPSSLAACIVEEKSSERG